MAKLHFFYEMKIDYSTEVGRCNFTIKCVPQDTKRQKILDYQIVVEPATSYQCGRDGLGNYQIYGTNEMPHKTFLFQIQGEAETDLAPYELPYDPEIDMVFAHPYGLNRAGQRLNAYYTAHKDEITGNAYERALQWMHLLHRDFLYVKGCTTVSTSAEEAFALGQGVCQDYAHIYIAIMHLANIPARYVTGLITGEGASHAWVEILHEDFWYGMDPTNDLEVREQYVRIGMGRDASDCMINRGIMHGGGEHTQTIWVNVEQ